MSQATKQTIGLLAVISGCMKTIYDIRLAPDHDPVVIYTHDICNKVVNTFPNPGNEYKLQIWISKHMHVYDRALARIPKERYNAALLTAMSLHILLDLQHRINDPKKLEILEPIYEAVRSLNELIDPKGRKIAEFERGEYLVSIAYQIFGFEPK